MAALLFSLPLAGCSTDGPIDVQDGSGPIRDHDVDLYVPSGARESPATVVFVPGGSWVRDGRRQDRDVYERVGRSLASRGFDAAVMSHRVGGEIGYREEAGDVARVFASMFRRSSEAGESSNRVFLAGFSSGAHLAALVALDPRYLAGEGLLPGDLAGVVGISGVYDLPSLAGSDSARRTLVPAFGPDPRDWVDASPVFHVRGRGTTPSPFVPPALPLRGKGRASGPLPADRGPPPFLLLVGEEEGDAMAGQAATLAEALRLHGGRARVAVVPGRDHDSVVLDFGTDRDPVLAEVEAFVAGRRVFPGAPPVSSMEMVGTGMEGSP